MNNVTPEHDAWLEHLSDAQLELIIDQMSVDPTDAQRVYIDGLRVLLADRIGRRAFWIIGIDPKAIPTRQSA